ncbi:MAG: efflux RND transporter periplasmic adaptor subunit [Blastocatellia bacterium]
MKKTGILLLALGLLAGGGASCGGEQGSGSGREEKPAVVSGVKTEEVVESKIEDRYEASGTVRSKTSSDLSAKVMGVVTAVRVREGERVRAGQVLVEIENQEARAALGKAQAGLREAQAGIQEVEQNAQAAQAARRAAEAGRELAQATLQRYQGLHERKSVSDQEFDEVKARARVAEAELERANRMVQVVEARRTMVTAKIEQARADVAAAEVVAGYARVAAPFAGVVTARHVEVGTLASPGVPLLTVEETGNYRLEVAIDELRMGQISRETPVKVQIDALGLGEMAGQVVEIVPATDPATRTYTVKVTLPIEPRIRSGMFGRAHFQMGERPAILIPGSAVVRQGQLTGVFVVGEGGRTRLRLVTLGDEREGRREILSGLTPGERLVVESARIGREGVQVQ